MGNYIAISFSKGNAYMNKSSRLFKLIAIILSVVIILITTSCSYSSKSGNLNGNNNAPVSSLKVKSNTMLLFEIDEGIGGVELTTVFTDQKKYDEALNNIYQGLKPFMQGYKVSVLIYPQNGYKYEGYGVLKNNPLDRISPNLRKALDFFKSKKINVYFEIYYSGIWTNQN